MENMDHAIHHVEECPPTGFHALDMVRPYAVGTKTLQYVFGKCSHVDVRGAGGDHEKIDRVTDGAQIEHGHVDRLVLV